jgi:uncharacterized membrane protein
MTKKKTHEYPGAPSFAPPSYEEAPLNRSEYISALVHFYRGELDRSTQWRLRLDTTTNWAIFSVMGLITFSLGDPSHSHVGILAGMILVFTFLGIEARRFRFFDVWRARVRMLEENFFGPIFRRDLASPVERWGVMVAEDLLRPRFKITYHQALRARLYRNYGVLFVLLLLSWVLKLLMHAGAGTAPELAGAGHPWLHRMALGPVPWWVPMCFVIGMYFYLLAILVLVPAISAPEQEYWGVDEVNEKVSRFDI